MEILFFANCMMERIQLPHLHYFTPSSSMYDGCKITQKVEQKNNFALFFVFHVIIVVFTRKTEENW
jgi:hypothetical protein